MDTIHTANQHESSVTVVRTDGSKIDFCSMQDEIIIGETKGESHVQIILSIAEAEKLQSHLATVLG